MQSVEGAGSSKPRKALVTGVAGFIGSHLAERLLGQGWQVVGVDALTDYYPAWIKWRNLNGLLGNPEFTFVKGDLTSIDLAPLVEGVNVIFHQAAQAGVRASWGDQFSVYLRDNLDSTQRLLEAARASAVDKFVFASSSSIYGDAETLPTTEEMMPKPVSPYGVTKLAGEHLARLYARSYGVPTVGLRYFTVFGPRQRPDMAFHRFIRALLLGKPISVYGDGLQSRDFTFVADIVDANIMAAEIGAPGEVYNIGGGSRIALIDAINLLAELVGAPAELIYQDAQEGDARHTGADISKAGQQLGYRPTASLREGLAAEVEWVRALLLEAPQASAE